MASQQNPVINLQKAINDLSKIVKELSERIRLVEEKIEGIEATISEIQEKDRSVFQELNSFKKNTSLVLDDLTKRTTTLEMNLLNLEKDLKNYAKKVELKEIKYYIDLIKPVTTRFVTKQEVEVMMKKLKANKS